MVAPIRVAIVGDAQGLKTTLGDASTHVDLFGKKVGVDLPGWAGVAVNATKKIGTAVFNSGKAAKDAAAEEAIFAESMAKLGVTTEEQTAKVDGAILASQKLAFEDTETRKALVSLTTATGDSDKAIDLLSKSQDIARLAGVDLATAADAVAKAEAGQDTTLRRMLPGLAETATAQDTITEASNLAAGAADKYGKSSAAGAKKAQIGFSELKETVGAQLGPALKDLGDSLRPIIKSLLELAATVLPPVIKGISVAAKAFAKVLDAINRVIEAIKKLMGWLKDLIAPITNVIDKLGKIDLNPFNRAKGIVEGQSASASSFAAPQQQAAQGAKSGVTINIYGDPSVIEARVTSALRAYARRNGVAAVFSPDRN
jgi:hypothetical protein